MKKPILFSTFLIGFTAMSSQIILLRQLIVVFYGNEISLGILLGSWLFWGALGGWLLGRLVDKIKDRHFAFALLEIILGLALVAVVAIIRDSRAILGILPGEIIGFLPMVAFSFCVVSLICVTLGFLFALACRVYPQKSNGALQIGRVYILESLGAVCGGFLISFLFIRYFDALYIMMALAGINFIAASYILHRQHQKKYSIALKYLALGLSLTLLFLFATQRAKELKEVTIARQWRSFKPLTVKDSIYSNLVVTQADIQHSFFSNGLYLFTVPDDVSSEEAVHFALLETTDPKRTLLIGGGIGGLADEALKHPLSSLDYVELDPEIIRLGQQYLSADETLFLKDQRVKVFYRDGRSFIKQAARKPDFIPYDAIIVHLGDPYTALINRFYTLEFFQEAKKCLSASGVFSFSLSSAENFINQEQRQFLSSIYKTLKKVFSEVKIIPGDTAYFLATDEKGLLTYDYRKLSSRLKERNIETKFVREYYLSSKLTADRIAYLEGQVKEGEKAKLNLDFRPVSYYYDMVLWSTYFAQPWRKVFSRFDQQSLWTGFFVAYLLVLLFGFYCKAASGRSKPVLLAISTTGFTELSFQVVILLAFQIIYGYLYYKLGIILSSFMIGLVLGSWIITKKLNALADEYGLFIKTQAAISVYPLILPFVFYAANSYAQGGVLSWASSNIVFPALPIISGFMGGFQFPLAAKIILKNNDAVGRISGLAYGMDLFGSCLGALLVSTFLIPLLGITQTCFAIALLNTAVLVALLINRKK
ncbi:MAG: fused MFS/spermidine synthase [Candidatus Omnitrophica bacterium]|nr:fused MFS/spermidine synthase [Candidatus Omnitrophota bacterium]